MRYITGNLLALSQQNTFDVIIHGCNCFHKFGAGIAKQIRDIYPKAYEADLTTRKGDSNKLGTYSYAAYPNILIINGYIQYRYGRDEIHVDYDAINTLFYNVSQAIDEDRRIGIPKIGSGLAGGDWDRIESIINHHLRNHNVTCVIYEP